MKLKQIENSPDVMKQMADLDEKIPAPKWLNPALIVLSALCFVALAVGTLLIALNVDKADPSFVNTQNNYMLLFFLPVPLIALAACIYSLVKNYEVKLIPHCTLSILIFAIMLIFGLSTFYTSGLYKHDYAYVDNVEQITGLALPENGTISTQYINQSQSDLGLSVKVYSGIKFTDTAEAERFKEFVFNQPQKWLVPEINPEKAELITSLLPQVLEISTSKENSRFLYFNVADGVFNKLPEKTGLCDLIVIAYNAENDTMRIWEISYRVYEYEIPGGTNTQPE